MWSVWCSSARHRRPHWGRDFRLWILLLAALLAVTAIGAVWRLSQLGRLADTVLTGTRLLNGRACIAIAADISGSMINYTQQRRDAAAALLPWLHDNLLPTDLIAIAAFTDQAALMLPATPVGQLPAAPPAEPALPGVSTAAAPAIHILGDTFNRDHCAAMELIMISDGKLGDTPTELRDALHQASITRTLVLNPAHNLRPPPLDDPALRGIATVSLGDANHQALTYGRAIADLTGQHLTKTMH